MVLRALVVWLVMLIVAVCNGAFREFVLVPRLGQGVAHVASTLILCACIGTVVYFAIPRILPRSAGDAVSIGAGWLLLTLAFEFGFGRLRGRSWVDLLADYDVLNGRIWLLVLIVTLLAPLVMARERQILPPESLG
jgi:hypothetical protein